MNWVTSAEAVVQPAVIRLFHPVPGLTKLFAGPPYGIGMLTASLILAIMVLPFITAVSRDVFETVPAMLKESAYGIGCTRWEVVKNVVIPHTRVGLIGGERLFRLAELLFHRGIARTAKRGARGDDARKVEALRDVLLEQIAFRLEIKQSRDGRHKGNTFREVPVQADQVKTETTALACALIEETRLVHIVPLGKPIHGPVDAQNHRIVEVGFP